jgi:hypothetical protein
MAASIAYRAVAAIVDPEVSVTIAALLDAGAILPETVPLFEYLLRLLERFDAAEECETGWRLADDHDLPDVAEIWRLLLAEAPELVAELALLATAAEELPALLRDGLRRFEPAPLPMAEHLVQASPVSVAAFEHIRETLAEIGAAWLADWPLRVLEIGADSAVTPRLIEALAQTGRRLPIGRPIRILSRPRGLPERSSRRPEQAPVAGPSPTMMTRSASRFDVIVSLQALRSCSSMPMCCRDCASGLRPAGSCAAEAEANPLWALALAGIAVGGATRQGARGRVALAALRSVAPRPGPGGFAAPGSMRPAQDRGRCRFCGRGRRRNKNRRGPTCRTHCRWR